MRPHGYTTVTDLIRLEWQDIMRKPKPRKSSSSTIRWILLTLLLVAVWGLFATNMFEVLVSGKVISLRLLRNHLSRACTSDELTSLVYDMSPLKDDKATFSETELARIKACNRSADTQRKHGNKKTKMFKPVRWTSHTYLDNGSTVVELGGYMGDDIENLLSRFTPRRYIVVEPVYVFYKKLVERFKHVPNVLIYHFGIGDKNDRTTVSMRRDGTSSFNTKEGGVDIRLVSAQSFFLGIGVGFFDVDLLTMNCEGCEFAVLDFLLSTNLINNIRNIQFQPHKIEQVKDSVYKYCEYHERLKRTHDVVFRHPFWWESWTLKYKRLPNIFDDITNNSTLMDEILS
ncbi:uncharacterized protein LOC110456320 isoform X2 [Mizuhopecten yessoensis]|uniref:uncharacterized protein LOC110456320 isoform X2 n=1 Tax=Mizuhopecten yessoensis TaxID=6573 RepID=UPI000B45826C|nr:uncharacterized protein LOC110456320 isoform X2 [Mizuhopecten yessoensis]